jgi:hypothetical protein
VVLEDETMPAKAKLLPTAPAAIVIGGGCDWLMHLHH